MIKHIQEESMTKESITKRICEIILERYKIDMSDRINIPLLEDRSMFRARDIIYILDTLLCENNIQRKYLTAYTYDITVEKLSQYILECFQRKKYDY